jgi:hypothetical protein
MTRFVVDCETLLRIAGGEIEVAPEHKLVAPTLVHSQALSALYEVARRGEISVAEGSAHTATGGRVRHFRQRSDAVGLRPREDGHRRRAANGLNGGHRPQAASLGQRSGMTPEGRLPIHVESILVG